MVLFALWETIAGIRTVGFQKSLYWGRPSATVVTAADTDWTPDLQGFGAESGCACSRSEECTTVPGHWQGSAIENSSQEVEITADITSPETARQLLTQLQFRKTENR